ncbi:hypothetical protein K488DRAFT_76869 [Vararia minispora EC-137]|uniref:Uncharacterized protein n=1 Tax=Vararia minispora EC-137 TaxID=1314806 RepID=A0ACB8QTE1_9AGAM|nr:hypothetical protein K488DRAFT_76869 [Vararia minispora EC-137]
MFLPVRSLPQVHAVRFLHATSRLARTLIGPPDPISNLRPVLYDASDTPRPVKSTVVIHPYSLSEFARPESDLEYGWRWHRKQLDAFNHAFWTDANTRFTSARDDALSSLPPNATSKARDAVLADLYRRWVLQEASRQAEYNRQFRRRTYEEIKLAMRVHWSRFTRRIGLQRAQESNSDWH